MESKKTPKAQTKTAKAQPRKNSTAKNAKKRGKKRRSLWQLIKETWFWKIWSVLVLLSIAVIVVLMNVVRGYMVEYEQTRPIHTVETVFETIEARDWTQIYAMDESAKLLTQETAEQYASYMEEITAGKTFTLKTLVSLNDNESKYSVLADGQKFAEITLEHSGETTAHNFEGWRLKDMKTTAMASSAYTITVPSDSVVKVNGIELASDAIIETGIKTAAEGNLPDGVTAPTMVKYAVYMNFGAPETSSFDVTDKNGNTQTVTQVDDKSWSCGMAYDDSIKSKCEDGAVSWGRKIAAYTTGDYSKFDLSNACVNPSPARTYIRNMNNTWAAKHSGYDFKNVKTYDYFIYDNSNFSCKISFDYVVHYTKQDKSYPTCYTLYFTKSGKKWKLYSFTIDAAQSDT